MVIILIIQKKEIAEQPGEVDKPSPGIRLCDDAPGTRRGRGQRAGTPYISYM